MLSRGIVGMQKWGIAACGLALSVSIADAAEIKSFNLKDDSVEISISGNIASGDIDVLRASIKAANDAGKSVTSLRLNSEVRQFARSCPGGRLGQVCENIHKSRAGRSLRISLLSHFRGRGNQIRKY